MHFHAAPLVFSISCSRTLSNTVATVKVLTWSHAHLCLSCPVVCLTCWHHTKVRFPLLIASFQKIAQSHGRAEETQQACALLMLTL